jgi:hypothetical protein
VTRVRVTLRLFGLGGCGISSVPPPLDAQMISLKPFSALIRASIRLSINLRSLHG